MFKELFLKTIEFIVATVQLFQLIFFESKTLASANFLSFDMAQNDLVDEDISYPNF
jgi:hypothetical protein